MKILLNHLSIEDLISNFNNIDKTSAIYNFSHCLKMISLYEDITKINLIGNIVSILDIELPSRSDFRDFIRSCTDAEARGIALSRLSNYSQSADILNESVNYSISIFSNTPWEEIKTPLNKLSNKLSEVKNIPNLNSNDLYKVASRSHILLDFLGHQHQSFLNEKYIDFFYNHDFEVNYLLLMRSKDERKQSLIKDLSGLICSLSGFTKDNKISKKNSRDIYFHSEKNLYLSTDFLHGTFEVLDNKGLHLCEINFKGVQISGKDTSGKHNINIS